MHISIQTENFLRSERIKRKLKHINKSEFKRIQYEFQDR